MSNLFNLEKKLSNPPIGEASPHSWFIITSFSNSQNHFALGRCVFTFRECRMKKEGIISQNPSFPVSACMATGLVADVSPSVGYFNSMNKISPDSKIHLNVFWSFASLHKHFKKRWLTKKEKWHFIFHNKPPLGKLYSLGKTQEGALFNIFFLLVTL